VGFLKPDFEILFFFRTTLAFFGNQKTPDNIWLYFSRKSLALEKHYLSGIFITDLF